MVDPRRKSGRVRLVVTALPVVSALVFLAAAAWNLVRVQGLAASLPGTGAQDELLSTAKLLLAAAAVLTVVAMAAAAILWRRLGSDQRAAAAEEHSRRLQSLGDMASVLSHELKNPLASLKGNAQLLARRLPVEGRDRKKAERLVKEASRLETLCFDLLDFCSDSAIELRDVDPSKVVDDARRLVITDLLSQSGTDLDEETAFGMRRIEVDVSRCPQSWSLDPSQLRLALINILRNAVQASPDGQPVTVALVADKGELTITVRDRGAGLPEGDPARIFEPFVTFKSQGTGLGLAVARRVMTLHSGTISARNHPGGGAEFRLTLPASDA